MPAVPSPPRKPRYKLIRVVRHKPSNAGTFVPNLYSRTDVACFVGGSEPISYVMWVYV